MKMPLFTVWLLAQAVAWGALPRIVAVLHGASLEAAIAPETWIYISGQNLAATNLTRSLPPSLDAPLPKSLGGVSVLVNGQEAFLASISPSRLFALTPAELQSGSGSVEVLNASGRSTPFEVPVEDAAPGLFSYPDSGRVMAHAPAGQPLQSARPGDTLRVYATGLGSDPEPVGLRLWMGEIALSADARPFSPGLFQIAFSVPPQQAGGDSALAAEASGMRGRAAALSVQEDSNASPAWSPRSRMPNPRGATRAVTLDGKIFVLAGATGTPAVLAPQFDGFEIYDPLTDKWSTKISMPQFTGYSGAAAVGGRIYALDGVTGGVHEFYPARGTWVAKAAMPTPRTIFATAVVNNRVYTLGGLAKGAGDRYGNSATVEEYDPRTDTWKARASLPGPRHALAAASVGGKIYIIGGDAPYPVSYDRSIGDVSEYDPRTDRWTSKRSAPMGLHYHCVVACGSKIYVFGGPDSNLRSTMVYDPEADSWAAGPPRPAARWIMSGAEAYGRIYLFGGYSDLDFPVTLPTVEAYHPGADRQ